MSKIPPHIVDQILQTARIEEVIGEFVQLKRAGSNLKGLSPFTDEKTPSFVVSPAKQIFKCFSTGKGGNAASFLMEKEHFSYPEALRWLAKRYNIEVPEEREASAEELAALNERESFLIINEFAKNTFSQMLLNDQEGKAIGLSYFEERGFSRATIEKFQLGYCLNTGSAFTDLALDKGYNKAYLEAIGLTKSKENRYFDFFKGRVIFPIHSVSGRVLGFGGRTLLSDKKVAKYFNSPESSIYNKSEILYGLHFAKGDIVKYNECLLCEGYTDVISMHQAGIQNVVSSSGTSLTKEQVKLVSRYTKNLTILYDGDAAGIKASFRGIDLILEGGLNVKVVLFPDGEDPDSFSKSRSSAELSAYIAAHKQDFISFKAGILLADGANDPILRAGLIKDIVNSVSLIPDQITRSVYVQQLAQQFDISESIVQSELLNLRKTALAKTYQDPALGNIELPKNPSPQSLEASPEKEADQTIFEAEIIRMLIKYGTRALIWQEPGQPETQTSVIELIVQELKKDDLHFVTPLYQEIYSIFEKGVLEENTFYESTFFLRHDDQQIVQFVADIEAQEQELSHNWVARYKIQTKSESDDLYQTVVQVIYRFKLSSVEEKINKIRSELTQDLLKDNDLLLALGELVSLEKVKMLLSEQIGITLIR
ncbi:MAG: DNA primase [Cryomorphaceae bacterium]|jgi:DNA primase|nr:DNA primase [Cryomorphaceae bacterium]